MWLKEKVHELVKKHKTFNPFEIAEQKNIHVIKWDLHEQIQGYYKYDRRNRYIVINKNLSYEYQRFVCAHELGHAILHPRMNTPFLQRNTFFSTDKIEREANTFAVELLIPDDEFLEMAKQGFSVNEIAMIYGVPVEVAHLKDCRKQ